MIVVENSDAHLVTEKQFMLLYFTATWCGPCKRVLPIIEQLSTDEMYKNIEFCKIDIDLCDQLTNSYGITSVPTFILVDGEIDHSIIERTSGADSKSIDVLSGMLKKVSCVTKK